MDLQAEKSTIIEQFKQINDIDLIHAIKSLLDYALNKEKSDAENEIPESHKEIVRGRIKKYQENHESYLNWSDIEQKISTRK
jgi:hypothetical protein